MPDGRIFISYRRDDAKYPAHLLYERLIAEFGPERVFMDISDIPFGVNFRDHIRERMRDSTICLALMGSRWLELLNQRAEDARDFVRIELELAHELGVSVIPVTLDDTPIPRQEALPESLWPLQLADINSLPLRGGPDLKSDLDRLVAGLAGLMPATPVRASVSEPRAGVAAGAGGRWAAVVVLLFSAVAAWWWFVERPAAPPTVAAASQSAPEVRLELAVNIAAATVEIDGQSYGPRREFELAPGEYRLVVRAEGHAPYEKAIVVDRDRRLTIDLQPRLATLTLRSNVLDDRAFVDGREVGSTRLDLDLPLGRHEVRIEKAGYQPFTDTLELTGDATVRAVLLPVDAAPGAEKDKPAEAVYRPGDSFRDSLADGSTGPSMKVLPAGRYRMGSPESESGRQSHEGPQHVVDVAAFAIGEREVTVGEFALFVESSGYRTLAEQGGVCERMSGLSYEPGPGLNWRDPGYVQSDQHPVVCVAYADALAYIEWLGRQTGAAYRLPTEAEWEYAARGGTQSSRWWGERADEACTYANVLDGKAAVSWLAARHRCDDRATGVAPVARYAANGFGLFDTLGNVWEWTADCWHASYAGAPSDGSARGNAGVGCADVVVRGGGWESSPDFVRSAVRLGRPPGVARFVRGFRLARSL